MTLPNYQQVLFEVPEYKQNQSKSLQEASLANLTVFLDSVWHLMTSVICGTKTGELLARLTRDGMWERTWQGYYQVSLDGSLVEFLETWPKWGITQDGVASELKQSAQYKEEKEFLLWPRPMATDWKSYHKDLEKLKGYLKRGHQLHWPHIVQLDTLTKEEYGQPHPEFGEWIMGFPIGWTDLEL